ncbi:uncharacterized protein STEHIDRAFT_109607 [Stereum hirsutum FP-91666 SS1]|uniref:uncharacterized protein n=1 Tax=Stereum hirsutum (strain FP-91666) TaxID=721885 RepID=UPI000440DC65|nr:uncharacterized protein STEHIDRAFT_109607 [Stereum hirsutum FP-91666 SS1]EIM89425.1 hypothetical protein STEHIDRAFT_109607 [Stereum hirsutum FP-91666 SS1]
MDGVVLLTHRLPPRSPVDVLPLTWHSRALSPFREARVPFRVPLRVHSGYILVGTCYPRRETISCPNYPVLDSTDIDTLVPVTVHCLDYHPPGRGSLALLLPFSLLETTLQYVCPLHNTEYFNLPLPKRTKDMWPPGRAAATPPAPANKNLTVLKHIGKKWLLRRAPTPSTLTPTTSATEFTIDTTSVTSCRSMDQDSQSSQFVSTKRYQFWNRSRTTQNAVLELVTLAGTILVEASQMTQGVPYVECLAKVIEYVAKASKELQTVKTTFSTLSERIIRLQGIIVGVREDSKRQGTLPLGLDDPFRLLERLLSQVINFLSGKEVSRLKRLTRFLNRKDVLCDLQKCELDINHAIEEFNTRLNIQQTLIEHDMKKSLSVVEDKMDAVKMITEEHEVRDQTRHVVVLIVLLISGTSGGSTLVVSAVLFGNPVHVGESGRLNREHIRW